ncbi:uncharacterized protein LOC116954453 isoform X1 [Petromyzon marinus]|uniref:Secreted phosphoprotein 24 n=1 Tax=Petromyzon marinus TaxID=7757 RepID=A0AAJ7XE05_PETMA|nr:secreted phosphoprotein 24-like isoform X1 [Petromyzon marinus]
MGPAVFLGLLAVLLCHFSTAHSARLNDNLRAVIIEKANSELQQPNLFGIYKVKKVKVGSGKMGSTSFVDFELKETLCPRSSGKNPSICEFNPAASPALWECKAILTKSNTNAPVVSDLSCDQESSEESNSDSHHDFYGRQFVNRRPRRGEPQDGNKKPRRRPGFMHIAGRPGKPDTRKDNPHSH